MKMQRRVAHAGAWAGVKQASEGAGGGVEPLDFGSNMFATRGGPESPGPGGSLTDLLKYAEDSAEYEKNRSQTLNHDACVVSGARGHRYMPSESATGTAELITSSDPYHTTLDQFSSSRKFLADRERFRSDATAWKHAVSTDANMGGAYGKMGKEETPVTGKKLALIIGNSDYWYHEDLPGAALDASAMNGYYQGLGFTTVRLKNLDGGLAAGMISRMKGYGSEGDQVVVYFAGHGDRTGVFGVDHTDTGAKGVVDWSVMLDVANGAVSNGYSATIIMDSCGSDGLQKRAKAENSRVTFTEDMLMNVQSESSPEAWARMTKLFGEMGLTTPRTAADYQFLMERRHQLRREDNGEPKVAVKS